MEVELIEHTENPDKLCALCAWGDHRETIPDMDEMDMETTSEILDEALSSGHWGVIEHASFTFAVSGVSRVLTHQLVRHRIASYDQQSQRVVSMDNAEFIIPENIGEYAMFTKRFSEILNEIKELYGDMQEEGIPNEDARFILPNATKTNITITMNARSLRHFFKLRTCKEAQWEIIELAWKMLRRCKEVAPNIFEGAGAPCITGECPEEDPCDSPYTQEEVQKRLDR